MTTAHLRLTKSVLSSSGKIKNSQKNSLTDTAYYKSGTSIYQTNFQE